MCTVGYTRFPCGCSHPDPATLTRCEWAKLKGHVCPDFQISEDKSKSTTAEISCSADCAMVLRAWLTLLDNIPNEQSEASISSQPDRT
jgi:hypothetical protein